MIRDKFLIISSQLAMLLGMLLTGCGSGESILPEPHPGSHPEGAGDSVTLTFDMYGATVTRASGTTRAATGTVDMSIGTMFRIFAFYAGESDRSSPLGSKNYEIQPDETNSAKPGKATGDLTLYRGTYDLYLVSYNSSTEVPVLKSDGTIEVGNGRDFMYTKLEGIVVQPDKTGENTMLVSLPRPFTRMGARVITTVKTKNGIQPVSITSLKTNGVKITGLSDGLNYKLGKSAWEQGATYNSTITYNQFTREGIDKPWVSEGQVVLPVDGSQLLDFEVDLTVKYNEGNDTYIGSFPASIQKVLLPGMTYQFDFSLTFYGVLAPSDLTLAVKEYNTVDLSSDGLGGENQ